MNIYKAEKLAGLEEYFTNTSFASSVNCNFKKIDYNIAFKKSNIDKAKAALGIDRNFDVFYLSSILASVGSNENDDFFTQEELWEARETPIHKQFNYDHNEKDIIGCIFDSFLLDAEGGLITSEEDIDKIKDIGTHAVIWTKWEDDELQERMDRTIADIQNNELFVSMEVLFRDFDYMLLNKSKGTSEIIKRTAASAFLTKHLKVFGGTGSFEDFEIKRVLRSFTFSGKGLVENPANKRSVISTKLTEKDIKQSTNVVTAKTVANNKKGNFNMDPEKQIAELSAKLEIAKAEIESLKSESADEKLTSAQAEIEGLNKQVAELSEQNEKLTELAKASKVDAEKYEAEATESKKALEKSEANLKESQDTIAALELEKVQASRVSQLVEVGNSVEEAEEICKTWASVEEDQFNAIVDLHKKAKSAKDGKDKEDMDDEVDNSEASSDVDAADAVDSANASLNTSTDSEDISDEEFSALAKSIQEKLSKKENK